MFHTDSQKLNKIIYYPGKYFDIISKSKDKIKKLKKNCRQ